MSSDAHIRIVDLAADDSRVYLTQLRQTLHLMSHSTPFGVLGLAPEEADALSVRRAYLAAVKLYHPARYARCSPEIVELAQEVYFLVKQAYDRARVRLVQTSARTTRPPGVRSKSAPRRRPSTARLLAEAVAQRREVLKDQMRAAAEALHAGRFKEARQRYHRISVANPRTASIRALYHYTRGLELRQMGFEGEAQRELERALGADPSLEPAREALNVRRK